MAECYSVYWLGLLQPQWVSACSPTVLGLNWLSKHDHPHPTPISWLPDWCSVQHPDRNATNRKWRKHIVVVTLTRLGEWQEMIRKMSNVSFLLFICTVQFYENVAMLLQDWPPILITSPSLIFYKSEPVQVSLDTFHFLVTTFSLITDWWNGKSSCILNSLHHHVALSGSQC
jgi:hypothetical protein